MLTLNYLELKIIAMSIIKLTVFVVFIALWGPFTSNVESKIEHLDLNLELAIFRECTVHLVVNKVSRNCLKKQLE